MHPTEIPFNEKFSCCFEKKFYLLSNSLINDEPIFSNIVSCLSEGMGLSLTSAGSYLPVTAVYISYFMTFCDLTGVSNF